MIKEKRQQLLAAHINSHKAAQLKELSTLLNVSEDTVRRDIKELADQGLMKAVRGGAVAHSPMPLHYREREHLQLEQKEIIAQKALSFLRDGQVVFFDGGTSTLAVASALPKNLHVTVVTNSFPIVNVLEDHPLAEVLFLGGRLHKKSFTAVGAETIDLIRDITTDIAFLGVCSIDPEIGLTTLDYDDGLVKKNIVLHAKQVIALSTANKIGTAEPYFICPITAIDVILTDISMGENATNAFRRKGVELQ